MKIWRGFVKLGLGQFAGNYKGKPGNSLMNLLKNFIKTKVSGDLGKMGI
jgi:hypothetical protein